MLSVLLIFLLLGCLIIAYLVLQPKYVKMQRKKSRDTDFPKNWQFILSQQWPLYSRLPDLLKQNLHERIKLFLNEKQFVGCNGFEVNEQHKLLIAAQACLLIVNKPFDYFDKLTSILIYPSAFIVNRDHLQNDGTIKELQNINTGEAWETGKVILSWDDVYAGMINISDGHNVVLHEFAHLLDYTNGSANGAPLLEHAVNYNQWSKIFSAAHERLTHAINHGHHSFINPYGATNPAEFFAVSSELFFEKSQLFQNQEPDLHQQLVRFYAVDPALW